MYRQQGQTPLASKKCLGCMALMKYTADLNKIYIYTINDSIITVIKTNCYILILLCGSRKLSCVEDVQNFEIYSDNNHTIATIAKSASIYICASTSGYA